VKENTLVTNDGQSFLLVALNGTIPIHFRSNQYNIPLEIFLMKDYPRTPPIAFVRPTATMEVRQKHRHVDSSGQCYTSYLHHWVETTSDISGLILELQAVFGNDPPVYAKSTTINSPSSFSSGHHSSTNTMPNGGHLSAGSTTLSVYPPVVVPNSSTSSSLLLTKTKDEKGQLEQKVLSKLAELEQTIEADNKQFQLIQQRLNEGRNWLYQSIQALTKDKQCLEEQLQILNQKDKELSQWLEEHGGANVAIDNAFVPADPLSEQICQLVAEDAAIEDALYCIDKALTNGKIDLDSYMKNVRIFCREQFMKRALSQQIYAVQSSMHAGVQQQPPLGQ
jgi:ESCRT-I complex subunit TSG101